MLQCNRVLIGVDLRLVHGDARCGAESPALVCAVQAAKCAVMLQLQESWLRPYQVSARAACAAAVAVRPALSRSPAQQQKYTIHPEG